MKVGILGAGVSGLVALKTAIDAGHDVVCFEQTAKIGGCWSGDGTTGYDEYGNRKCDGMYKHLITNLPKEVMYFEGHAHRAQEKSFVCQEDIYAYIRSYSDKHLLPAHIKLCSKVVSIAPLSDDDPQTRWQMDVQDLRQQLATCIVQYEFDVVILAHGHFAFPCVADIEGMESFSGLRIHSNDFRDPEMFRNLSVLVVGVGPSGCDIARRLVAYSTVVYQSLRSTSHRFIPIDDNVRQKCEVQRFDKHGAHFVDGSFELFDAVIFCTGYTYKLPCIMTNCGLSVEDNCFKYLYRHCINIERPSMAMIGLPYGASLFPLVNLQARYYMAYLAGRFQLPPKELMLTSVIDEFKARRQKGVPDRAFHAFSDGGRALSSHMAAEASIAPTPDVVFNLMDALHVEWNDGDTFQVVSSKNFVRNASE